MSLSSVVFNLKRISGIYYTPGCTYNIFIAFPVLPNQPPMAYMHLHGSSVRTRFIAFGAGSSSFSYILFVSLDNLKLVYLYAYHTLLSFNIRSIVIKVCIVATVGRRIVKTFVRQAKQIQLNTEEMFFTYLKT